MPFLQCLLKIDAEFEENHSKDLLKFVGNIAFFNTKKGGLKWVAKFWYSFILKVCKIDCRSIPVGNTSVLLKGYLIKLSFLAFPFLFQEIVVSHIGLKEF